MLQKNHELWVEYSACTRREKIEKIENWVKEKWERYAETLGIKPAEYTNHLRVRLSRLAIVSAIVPDGCSVPPLVQERRFKRAIKRTRKRRRGVFNNLHAIVAAEGGSEHAEVTGGAHTVSGQPSSLVRGFTLKRVTADPPVGVITRVIQRHPRR
jgi:hypothetical protein